MVRRIERGGFEAEHWARVGRFDAPDAEVFAHAATHAQVVFTNDLDFGAILAATGARGPSVFQLRGQELAPDVVGAQVVAARRELEPELTTGALVSWDPRQARVRILPLRP